MEEISRLLAALSEFRPGLGFEPARLVALHKGLPQWTAGLLVAAGLLVCIAGPGKGPFRVVLAVPAVGFGWLLGLHLADVLHLAPTYATFGFAGLLGLGALTCPPAILFVAGGTGGALLGGELVEKADFWLGAVLGFVLAGAFALFASRFLYILISALVGAASFSLGAVALLSATRLGGLVLGFPSVTVAVAICVAMCSMAYQFKFAPSEEELAKKRAELARQKELLRDDKRRDKRFKNYSKPARD